MSARNLSFALVLALFTVAVAKPTRKPPRPPPLISTFVLQASGVANQKPPVIMGSGTIKYTATITLERVGSFAEGAYEGTIVVNEETKTSQRGGEFTGTYTATHTSKVTVELTKRAQGYVGETTAQFKTTGSGYAIGKRKRVDVPNQDIPPKRVYVTVRHDVLHYGEPSRSVAGVGISAIDSSDIDIGEFGGSLSRK